MTNQIELTEAAAMRKLVIIAVTLSRGRPFRWLVWFAALVVVDLAAANFINFDRELFRPLLTLSTLVLLAALIMQEIKGKQGGVK